jgi:hypothetical protein
MYICIYSYTNGHIHYTVYICHQNVWTCWRNQEACKANWAGLIAGKSIKMCLGRLVHSGTQNNKWLPHPDISNTLFQKMDLSLPAFLKCSLQSLAPGEILRVAQRACV